MRATSLTSLFFVLLALLFAAPALAAEGIDGSVGRDGANAERDVLTVQILLNQVPAAEGGPEEMLVPDGVCGPRTIFAIERFQRQQLGDGGVTGRLEPGQPGLERLQAVVDRQPRNDRIIKIALGERLFWQDGKRTELDERVTTRLQQYWQAVGVKASLEQLRSERFHNEMPWSAAFISWVMKQAGAGDDFHYSDSHWEYVAAAKKNRLAGNDNPYKAYRPSEQPTALGDIVVKRRATNTATYDNIETGHPTHGDFVVAIKDGQAETIGGNVSNSVRTTMFPLDDQLHVSDERYFAIVKVKHK